MWIKFALTVFVLVVRLDVFGQVAESSSEITVIDAVKALNCEFTSWAFDSLAQSTDTKKIIMIVAYSGRSEHPEMSLRRAHNAKTYITEYYNGGPFDRPAEKVVTAGGFERKEVGLVEVYVDGELKLSVSSLKNRDLKLQPCYLEQRDYCEDPFKKLFYPCKAKR